MDIALIVILCVVAALVIAFFASRWIGDYMARRNMEKQLGMKAERLSVKQWFAKHAPTKRRLIQIYTALLYNANIKGYISGEIYKSETTKYACVPGLNCYSCPGAVGACPLGALQNSLAESPVRAPYYVLGIFGIFCLTLARTICGFMCPVGLGQELLYKIRTPKLKKSRVTRILSYFKYVLLVVLVISIPLMFALQNVPLPGFCKYICPAGTLGGAIGLLINPANADMFGMLGGQFTWKFSLLVVFIVASVFIYRFFCRFFCPLGAIYGFFNRIALLGVQVEKSDCTNCGKCVSVCKMDIRKVGDHECINCGECISVCPTKAISWKGSKIFLHKSAIDEVPQSMRTIAVGADGGAQLEGRLDLTTVAANTAYIAADGAIEAADTVIETAQPADEEKTTAKARVKHGRGKEFWLKLGAAVLAGLVLIFAIVYYNFIDVPKPSASDPNENVTYGYEVGDTAPDFTVNLYDDGGTFNLFEHRGKLTVVNFWATWCTPCVEEIPYFDKLSDEKTDINVIAIHGSSSRDVQTYINDKWGEHSLTFAQDNLDGTACLTYQLLGGKGTWPMTVIIDADGKVLYNSTQSFKSYDDLLRLIVSLEGA